MTRLDLQDRMSKRGLLEAHNASALDGLKWTGFGHWTVALQEPAASIKSVDDGWIDRSIDPFSCVALKMDDMPRHAGLEVAPNETPSRTKPAARTNASGDTGPNSPPA